MKGVSGATSRDDLERRESVETRQREIGKDEIGFELTDERVEGRLRNPTRFQLHEKPPDSS